VESINVVVITGNHTRDPELRHTEGGTAVCDCRIAVNSRRKNGNGEWVDKANYFDVTVFGARGEAVAKYQKKGSPVAVEGRLDWRQWEAKDGSGKRQAVQIIANTVRFLDSGKGEKKEDEAAETPAASDEEQQPVAAGAGNEEGDIPF
jgi:single-strand DNA-binding protein